MIGSGVYCMRIIDKLKISQAFHGRNGANVLRTSILILFLIAFQLTAASGFPARADQKLPVFQTGESKSPSMRQAIHVLDGAGYGSRMVQEVDFLFGLNPVENPYVWVPLSGEANASSLAILSRYVSSGGKVILFSSGETPDPAMKRLIQLIGVNVAGSATVSKEALFYWGGAALPGPDVLSEGSRVLLIQPGLNETVLASWGSQYPAIVSTAKGALLNWPSGQAMSKSTNVIALSKVMPLIKPDSVVFTGQAPQAGPRAGHVFKTSGHLPALPQFGRKTDTSAAMSIQPHAAAIEPTYQHNPAIPARTSLASIKAPLDPVIGSPNAALMAVEPSTADTPRTEPLRLKPAPASARKSASAVQAVLPQVAQNQTQNSPRIKPSQPVAKPAPAVKAQSVANDPDSEVLNNILGNPAPGDNPNPQQMNVPKPDDPILKDKLDAAGQADPSTGERKKPFSFLDPDAATVIAPEFDYGTYSYNLRVLDDYRRRINQALETSRQLALDVPEEKVKNLLREAHQHKRKFESLYLGGQTQAGLDEYAEARKITLRALALTSASPRVEGRAIWLDRGSIVEAGNPQALRKLMLKLRHAGINIVYFETFNAGFPIYPSTLTRNNPMVKDWDPLKIAVEEGHKLGMEVHAWVWTFAVGNRRHNPLIGMPESYPGPVLAEGGMMSEALRNQAGGLSVDQRQHEYWLDPASEKTRAFLLSIYGEIVRKYDVDGLQLDYIRYPFQTSATRMGFDPVGRERFYQATGQSLDHLDDYTAKLWIAWKTYQVSSFVQQVSQTLRQIKPNVKISAAVFPMKRESRIVSIQQDWETWIDNGWVDTLSPMSYTADPQRLQGMFDYMQSSPRKRSLIYPGIALHRLDGGELVQQLEALRQHGGLGATLFAGAHLDQEKIDTLGAGPYKNMTSIPPHRNVVKSLQIILDDYHQKFGTLQAKGALSALPAEQTRAITEPMTRLNSSLAALSAFDNPVNMPAGQLSQAQAQLGDLQLATEAWLRNESANPLRANYFSHKVLLLNELLGYLIDKNKGAVANFASPGARPVATKTSPPQVTTKDATVRPTAKTVHNPASAEPDQSPAVAN